MPLDRFFTLPFDMLCVTDMDARFTQLSAAFTATLGYAPDELTDRPLIDLVHPGDRAVTEAALARLGDDASAVCFENRYQCRDGSWRWLSWKMQSVAEDGLRYASARDVTELREKDEALWSRETRYQTLFSSIDEGFCTIEVIFDEQERPADYRFLEINPSFEQQTGIQNAVGRRMRDIAPEHEAHWFDIYGRIALGGESMRFQNHAKELGRWYDVYAFRLGPAAARQVAILFRDITEQKTNEMQIAALNADLRGRAAELEQVNRELESFSYSVSHDLRAPLRSIDGFSQMLLEDCGDQLNAGGRDALARVRRSAKDMSELIDALLSLSQTARAEIRGERVDLSAAAAAIMADLRQSQPARRGEILIAADMVAFGDARLLRAMLGNLLGNAWKYAQPREVTRIEFGCFTRDGETVYFIRDNGAGFDMAYVGKLFGPFQRLHRKAEFAGTGVGLATVQRIVHRHGGRVWAEGAVDHGATFYFTLQSASARDAGGQDHARRP